MAEQQQNVSPELQFQVGEQVLYRPQGIYTTIHGYLWFESIGSPPKLMGYILTCGITARWKDLAKVTQPLPVDNREPKSKRPENCPTCGSPDPARHPAVQLEGEVHICSDPFHGDRAQPLPAENKDLTPP